MVEPVIYEKLCLKKREQSGKCTLDDEIQDQFWVPPAREGCKSHSSLPSPVQNILPNCLKQW